jgi:FkbM family methyltransferase
MTEENDAPGSRALNRASGVVVLKDCRHGKMLFLKHDRYIGRSLDLYAEYSEIEAKFFEELLRPGDVVIEAGANIGAHTVSLAKRVGPRGQVIAFEPQRILFQILCANAIVNELFNIYAHHAALGREVGTIKVPILDYSTELNFGGISLGDAGVGVEVPLRTVDSLRLSALRLIKADVEGMETEVLYGARETIRKYRPILYVENDRESRSEELIGLLNELGYQQWWHLVPYYNPDNFAKNPHNIFDGMGSINLLCVAKEWKTNIRGFRQVSGPKDWWKSPSR